MMKTNDGRVASPPSHSGSAPSPSVSALTGECLSRDETESARPFRDVLDEAYDWLVDDDGYLWGLVAGDMGYDKTDMKLADLLTAAQVAEWDRFHDTGKKEWPVHYAINQFISILAEATEPPASAMEAAEGGRDPSGLDPKDDSAVGGNAETPSPTPAPLPMED